MSSAAVANSNNNVQDYRIIDVDLTLKASDITKIPYSLVDKSVYGEQSEPAEKIEYTSYKIDESIHLPTQLHGFIAAIHTSFCNHLPLIISADDIWTIIVQGLSEHINMNADKHRCKLVDFEGKKDLLVVRDSFILGSPNNDWMGVLPEFEQQINASKKQSNELKENITDHIVQNYSTTSALNTFIYQAVLMEGMKNFFTYTVSTRCGIPKVILKGTEQDWDNLLSNYDKLNLTEFDNDLKPWNNSLKIIINNLVQYRKGNNLTESINFFKNIYKYNANKGSGSPSITGWIGGLFPYFKGGYWKKGDKSMEHHTNIFSGTNKSTTDVFSSGVTVVPFIWDYYGDKLNMEIQAGFIQPAIEQDSNKPLYGVSTRYGYKIVHKPKADDKSQTTNKKA